MRSDESRRALNLGFTLLEAILAVATSGMILAGVYSIAINGFSRQTKAVKDAELAAVARAVLDEYTVTWSRLPPTGRYKNTWEWTITEIPQDPVEPTSLDHYFDFRKVTAVVRSVAAPEGTEFALSTVIAHRADK